MLQNRKYIALCDTSHEIHRFDHVGTSSDCGFRCPQRDPSNLYTSYHSFGVFSYNTCSISVFQMAVHREVDLQHDTARKM